MDPAGGDEGRKGGAACAPEASSGWNDGGRGEARVAGVREGNGMAAAGEGPANGKSAAGSRGGDRIEATDVEREQAEKLTHEQLLEGYLGLQSEVRALRQQLSKKDEQRLTAIKLLKRAKKRHEEEKARQGQQAPEPTPRATRDRGLSLPLSALTAERPDSPTASLGGSSILSFNQSGIYKRASARRAPSMSSLGLKELVDPDYRLSTVLEKLTSDRVLNALESLVSSMENGLATTPRGMPPHQLPSSFATLRSRMPSRMFPMGADLLATAGATGSQSHHHTSQY
eukprot:evm.model.scf_43EXC.11 EVM.evm.TU.scf_43EXC.11   scf_43EXC:122936-129220(-)